MSNLVIPPNSEDHSQGKDDSHTVLVEYGDFECPYCGDAYPVVKKLQAYKGETLKFIFRNFPLSKIHPHALHAAYAAEAAALQGKYWEMHDLIFENQEALADDDLIDYAEKLALNKQQFINSMHAAEIIDKVETDFVNGVHSGVNGTPTFFINGVRYDGANELDSLLRAIGPDKNDHVQKILKNETKYHERTIKKGSNSAGF